MFVCPSHQLLPSSPSASVRNLHSMTDAAEARVPVNGSVSSPVLEVPEEQVEVQCARKRILCSIGVNLRTFSSSLGSILGPEPRQHREAEEGQLAEGKGSQAMEKFFSRASVSEPRSTIHWAFIDDSNEKYHTATPHPRQKATFGSRGRNGSEETFMTGSRRKLDCLAAGDRRGFHGVPGMMDG